MLGSIQRDRLRQVLKIPENLEILLVIALGRPKETVVLEEAAPGDSIKYWRDAAGVHHVPKGGWRILFSRMGLARPRGRPRRRARLRRHAGGRVSRPPFFLGALQSAGGTPAPGGNVVCVRRTLGS